MDLFDSSLLDCLYSNGLHVSGVISRSHFLSSSVDGSPPELHLLCKQQPHLKKSCRVSSIVLLTKKAGCYSLFLTNKRRRSDNKKIRRQGPRRQSGKSLSFPGSNLGDSENSLPTLSLPRLPLLEDHLTTGSLLLG